MTEIQAPYVPVGADKVSTGTWTDPRDGSVYEQDFTPALVREYHEWAPGFMLALNAGVMDEWIYDIAKACHERHILTDGRASKNKPVPAGQQKLPELTYPVNIENKMVLTAGSVKFASPAVAARLKKNQALLHKGKLYPIIRLVGSYFLSLTSWDMEYRDVWFRIEAYNSDDNTLTCRAVRYVQTRDQGPRIMLGDIAVFTASDLDFLLATKEN